ncbi:ABC transporter permease [Desulfitobacterium sp. PCE1]|uniref:ABC transporter permease n=1 Tax=Desulfitobacterium sp. PCE1 TaxID=146907 RepID=UPI000368E3F3|nr:ABC transporter permease [Desulfitobacterium sp. PCE1]
MKSKMIGIIGVFLLSFLILIGVFAEQIAPYSPYQQVGANFQKPSSAHILGTNDIGQDIFSELIYGTRNSLLVGALSASVAMMIAVLVGVISGWYGGAADRLLMKITTFFLTIPFLPAVIILAAFTKGSLWSMSIILGLMSWPGVARVLRSATMEIKGSSYIKIIQGMGAGDVYVLTHHVLRELVPLILYRAVTRVKSGILSEASMSFLGLGNPVAKSWGSIIYYAQAKNALLTGAWVWWIIPPGLCICLVSMSLMMITYSLEAKSDVRVESGL